MSLRGYTSLTRADQAVGAALLVFIALAVRSCIGEIAALPPAHEVCSTVAIVGACDWEAWCGVTLEDGTQTTMRYASPGRRVCRLVSEEDTP